MDREAFEVYGLIKNKNNPLEECVLAEIAKGLATYGKYKKALEIAGTIKKLGIRSHILDNIAEKAIANCHVRNQKPKRCKKS